MIKISKNDYINETLVEAVCTYHKSKPLVRLASESLSHNTGRMIRGRYGCKSLFVMNDGYVFLCPYTPETYMTKLDASEYLQIERKKYYIKTCMIREICTKLSIGQRRDVIKAKKNGSYINLSGNKKVKNYIFTTSGRIYGAQYIASINGPEQ